jgi:hypothetical protein
LNSNPRSKLERARRIPHVQARDARKEIAFSGRKKYELQDETPHRNFEATLLGLRNFEFSLVLQTKIVAMKIDDYRSDHAPIHCNFESDLVITALIKQRNLDQKESKEKRGKEKQVELPTTWEDLDPVSLNRSWTWCKRCGCPNA